MPLYEYHCRSCDQRVEMLVPMSATTRTLRCPECGERALDKLLSTFAAAVGSASVGEPCAAPGCPRASGFS